MKTHEDEVRTHLARYFGIVEEAPRGKTLALDTVAIYRLLALSVELSDRVEELEHQVKELRESREE